jgi:hypothetical protein
MGSSLREFQKRPSCIGGIRGKLKRIQRGKWAQVVIWHLLIHAGLPLLSNDDLTPLTHGRGEPRMAHGVVPQGETH